MLCFIDESGVSNPKESSKVFVLGAVLIDETEHKRLTRKLNKLKLDIFGTRDIVLHTAEMTRPLRSGSDIRFKCLINKDVRNSFYKKLNQLIDSVDVSTVFIIVDKDKLRGQYSDPMDAYEFALENLINRILWATGSEDIEMYPEQRNKKDDMNMSLIYKRYKKVGTRFHKAEVISSRINKFKHVKKKDNIAGSQLVDLLVTPIARDYAELKRKPKWNEVIVENVKSKIKHPNNLNIFPRSGN